jgi:hypothetical protein
MVRKQELVARDTMSTNTSGPTKFGDACTATKSPQSRIAQTNNEIRIMKQYLIAETVQFMLELLPDVFGFEEGGEVLDALPFGATEMGKVILRRVLLEYVGAVDFRVKVPYS